MSNKLIILAKDSYGTIPQTLEDISTEFIEPTEFLEDGIHDIPFIYKDAFSNDSKDAKELLEELIDTNKRTSMPYIFGVAEAIHSSREPIVIINSSILCNDDIKFIAQIFDDILFLTEINNTSESSHYVIGVPSTGETYVTKDVADFKQEAFDALKDIHRLPPTYVVEEV